MQRFCDLTWDRVRALAEPSADASGQRQCWELRRDVANRALQTALTAATAPAPSTAWGSTVRMRLSKASGNVSAGQYEMRVTWRGIVEGDDAAAAPRCRVVPAAAPSCIPDACTLALGQWTPTDGGWLGLGGGAAVSVMDWMLWAPDAPLGVARTPQQAGAALSKRDAKAAKRAQAAATEPPDATLARWRGTRAADAAAWDEGLVLDATTSRSWDASVRDGVERGYVTPVDGACVLATHTVTLVGALRAAAAAAPPPPSHAARSNEEEVNENPTHPPMTRVEPCETAVGP